MAAVAAERELAMEAAVEAEAAEAEAEKNEANALEEAANALAEVCDRNPKNPPPAAWAPPHWHRHVASLFHTMQRHFFLEALTWHKRALSRL